MLAILMYWCNLAWQICRKLSMVSMLALSTLSHFGLRGHASSNLIGSTMKPFTKISTQLTKQTVVTTIIFHDNIKNPEGHVFLGHVIAWTLLQKNLPERALAHTITINTYKPHHSKISQNSEMTWHCATHALVEGLQFSRLRTLERAMFTNTQWEHVAHATEEGCPQFR